MIENNINLTESLFAEIKAYCRAFNVPLTTEMLPQLISTVRWMHRPINTRLLNLGITGQSWMKNYAFTNANQHALRAGKARIKHKVSEVYTR